MSGIQKLFLPRSEEDDVAESAFSSSKGRKRGGLIGTNLRKGKGKGGWSIDESPTERTGAAMKWKYTHGGIDG